MGEWRVQVNTPSVTLTLCFPMDPYHSLFPYGTHTAHVPTFSITSSLEKPTESDFMLLAPLVRPCDLPECAGLWRRALGLFTFSEAAFP